MSVKIRDIIAYGCSVMPDDDIVTAIGGAISTAKCPIFNDIAVAGNIQIVSSNGADITQTVQITSYTQGGVLVSETKTLNGLNVVPMTVYPNLSRLLKAIKSASTVGDVAVEAVTAATSGTAQTGSTDGITLATAASTEDSAYNNKVIRITGGTGAGQIARIVSYNGTTKLAEISKDWTTVPDATSTYKISDGMLFQKLPNEVLEVRRIFMHAAAAAPGGAARTYYEKVFLANTHATLALSNATILESSDPGGNIAFALENGLDGTGTNGAGNNRLAVGTLSGLTFDSSLKAVSNGQVHTAGAAQGVWLQLTLAAGAVAANNAYVLRESGTTI